MGTSLKDLAGWFEDGLARKATHMIVACDTFDHTDFPVYVEPGQDFWKVFGEYHIQPDKMLRVMEVYDLKKPWSQQSTGRVWNVPGESESPHPTGLPPRA